MDMKICLAALRCPQARYCPYNPPNNHQTVLAQVEDRDEEDCPLRIRMLMLVYMDMCDEMGIRKHHCTAGHYYEMTSAMRCYRQEMAIYLWTRCLFDGEKVDQPGRRLATLMQRLVDNLEPDYLLAVKEREERERKQNADFEEAYTKTWDEVMK